MRALIQRVCGATVRVEEQIVGQIDRGLLILLGISDTDGLPDMEYVAEKCANLRIFEDDHGKMNRSLLDTGGQALVVSQFTLHADTRKGRRPSFNRAAPPDIAKSCTSNLSSTSALLAFILKPAFLARICRLKFTIQAPLH